jgi:hypothetical protein
MPTSVKELKRARAFSPDLEMDAPVTRRHFRRSVERLDLEPTFAKGKL